MTKEIYLKIQGEINILNELYDYYLEKLDEEPYNRNYENRINDLRIEITTYEKVLEMIKGE